MQRVPPITNDVLVVDHGCQFGARGRETVTSAESDRLLTTGCTGDSGSDSIVHSIVIVNERETEREKKERNMYHFGIRNRTPSYIGDFGLGTGYKARQRLSLIEFRATGVSRND